jgi:hypothetical protein
MEEYNAFTNEGSQDGLYEKDDTVISTVMYISLYNDSDNVVKLYSIFPGDRDDALTNTKSGSAGYLVDTSGIKIFHNKYKNTEESSQRLNQYIYFRTCSAYDSSIRYYSTNESSTVYDSDIHIENSNVLSVIDAGNGDQKTVIRYSTMYPKVQSWDSLCLNTDEIESHMVIGPHEEILIPIIFKYDLSSGVKSTSKTMSFDIRKSLYKDPTNYTFRISANKTNTVQDKLIINSGHKMRKWWGSDLIRWTPKIK